MSKWVKMRRKALARRQRKCFYCDTPLWWKNKGGRPKGTVDHFVPLAEGGTNAADNLVLACKKCNSEKGRMLPAEYLVKIGKPELIPEWLDSSRALGLGVE